MGELLYPYLVAVIATVIVLTAGWSAYVRYRRAAIDHQQKAMRLPDFIKFLQLQKDVERLSKERDALLEAEHNAKRIIAEADQGKKWLDDNKDNLEQAERYRKEMAEVSERLQVAQNHLAQCREDTKAAEEVLQQRRSEVGVEEVKEKALSTQVQLHKEQLAKAEAEVGRCTSEVKGLQRQAATLEEQVRQAQGQLSALKDQVEKEGKALDAAQKDVVLAREEHKKLKDAIAESDKELRAREERLAACSAQLAGLQSQVDQLGKSAEHQQKRLDKLDEDVRARESVLKELGAQLEQKQAEKAKLSTEVANHKSEAEALAKTCEKLRLEKSGLDEDLKKMHAEEHRLLGAIAKATQLVPTSGVSEQEQIQDLFRPVIQSGKWDNASKLDEVAALRGVEEHLSERQVKFPRRVLHAFHTSLKVQNEAPLLVLAGISGTGKSLLPQLYAEAMGIHTLVTPVQPRWDGPQDLLGFYHHLEGRFKPTDLTRALLQFDGYLSKERRKAREEAKGDFHDRMLLVLLDEMNLARVEYYFSEFLSKLETRRDINPAIEVQRSKASLQLELGYAKGKDAPGEDRALELFAGNNVLFVGTINEDESTQSLSDKVVDRANVMRFGSPKQLARPQKSDNAQQAPGAKDALTYVSWDQWVRNAEDLSTQHMQLVQDVTKKLKELMDSVGRGLGHRTSKAIHRYVQQYPGRSDATVRFALADQIEQRILPKLRGIDPKQDLEMDAINRLVDIVRKDLADEPMADLIVAASNHHAFHWSGIDRSGE